MLSKYFLLASLAVLGVQASVDNAHVFITSRSPLQLNDASLPQSLSPSDARLVLAQQLRLSKYHSLENANAATLDAVNAYGGLSESLFGDADDECRRRALVVVEAVEDPAAIVSWTRSEATTFIMQHPPAPDANQHLIKDLSAQAAYDPSTCSGKMDNPWFLESKPMLEGTHKYSGNHAFVHVRTLEMSAEKHGFNSEEYRKEAGTIAQALEALRSDLAELSDMELIVMLMPPHQRSGSIFKRSTSSYGNYVVPRSDIDTLEHYHAETMPGPAIVDSLPAVEDVSAEDVTVSSDPTLSILDSMLSSVAADMASNSSSNSSRNSTSSSGILPACFSTLDACQTRTNNCTGHGSCMRAYTYSDGERDVSCYTCKCRPSVRKVKGSNSTTIWAGPACQKEDVSVPFWLLASSTVGLVSVVGWGIGLLYSMGSQELPSVIGAGVAGPRAK